MLRTAESVSPKHPDKLCDQLSDRVLDEALKGDSESRVAVEVAGGHGTVFVTGELTTKTTLDIEEIVREELGGDHKIIVNVVHQSPEIAQGVDTGGAGDQGIMVGYACSETEQHIPLEVQLSRDLNRVIFESYPYDGKTQITLDGTTIIAIVASFQHAKREQLKDIINNWLKDKETGEQLAIHCNPSGDWDQGGFDADAGLTGRKLVVDNYGPRIPIGGGCFSGKDPSKVDRSAAYMARKLAVDYLRKHKANEVYCYLAYAIGVAEPLQATVQIDGKELKHVEGYDLTPKGIATFLDLKKPQYAQTARYGHFGNGFTWDK